eukprot:79753-Pelagomonas_calceolata.AAC.6
MPGIAVPAHAGRSVAGGPPAVASATAAVPQTPACTWMVLVRVTSLPANPKFQNHLACGIYFRTWESCAMKLLLLDVLPMIPTCPERTHPTTVLHVPRHTQTSVMACALHTKVTTTIAKHMYAFLTTANATTLTTPHNGNHCRALCKGAQPPQNSHRSTQ